MGAYYCFYDSGNEGEYVGSISYERKHSIDKFCDRIGFKKIPMLRNLKTLTPFKENKIDEYIRELKENDKFFDGEKIKFIEQMSVDSIKQYKDRFNEDFYTFYFTDDFRVEDFKESMLKLLEWYRRGYTYDFEV